MNDLAFWAAIVLGGIALILAIGAVALRVIPGTMSRTGDFDINAYRAGQYGQGLLGIFSPALQASASGLQG